MSPSTLRQFIYNTLIDDGRVPSSGDIATHFSVSQSDALQALREMKIGKTILPDPRTGELWMMGPFAAVETQYSIRAGKRRWFANCAWDMLGVAHLVGEPVDIEAQCTDCGAPLGLHLEPDDDTVGADLLVHFLLPARRWYNDIGFT
jgi:alkylmercury lyase-like protein